MYGDLTFLNIYLNTKSKIFGKNAIYTQKNLQNTCELSEIVILRKSMNKNNLYVIFV